MLNFISWDMDPAIFSIGSLEIRYYGLMWASSFWLGYILLKKIYIKEGVKEELMDPLLYATLIGAVFGARFGHVIFYDFAYYFPANFWDEPLSNILTILNIREGGLASHGGAIGGILGIAWYVMFKIDKSFLWVIDRVVIVGALIGLFIRIGNFFNSEIVGVPTDKPWGVIFKRNIVGRDAMNQLVYEDFARHPAQLYEAAAYGVVLILLLLLYRKKSFLNQEGKMLGFFFITVFTARFFIEFIKNSQHGIESLFGNVLSTGQLLSIPFVLVGVWLMVRKSKVKPT